MIIDKSTNYALNVIVHYILHQTLPFTKVYLFRYIILILVQCNKYIPIHVV